MKEGGDREGIARHIRMWHRWRINKPVKEPHMIEPYKLQPPYAYMPNKADTLDAIRRAVSNDKRGGRQPNGKEHVTRLAVAAVEHLMATRIAADVEPYLATLLAEHTAMNGQRPSQGDPAADEWDSGLDDRMEALFSDPDVGRAVGQGWLGEHTIDSGLHLPDEIGRKAAKFGTAIVGNLSAMVEHSAAKMLSAAGIVMDDLQPIIDSYNGKTEAKEPMANVDMNFAVQLLNYVVTHAKTTGQDDLVIMAAIEEAGDKDAAKASAAFAALGFALTPQYHEAWQALAAAGGQGWAARAFAGEITGPDKLAKQAPAEAAPKRKGRAKPTDGPASGPGVNAPAPSAAANSFNFKGALSQLREHGGWTDGELAEQLGVSRATIGNYITGKSQFLPTDQQIGKIKALIEYRVGPLNQVYADMQAGIPGFAQMG